jgi:hypothetical protein
MSESDKRIHDWQNQLRANFDEAGKLYDYLFLTMENFFYRYLETSESKNLKVNELGEKHYGAYSFESDMVTALKIQDKEIKYGIMELAKSIPRAQKPMVRYALSVKVHQLTADEGHLDIFTEVNWDFPDFRSEKKKVKKIPFKYKDLNEFRKFLALKLEEACELFS